MAATCGAPARVCGGNRCAARARGVTDFGIFTAEGACEIDLYSTERAEAVLAADYDADDHAYVAAVCPEHRYEEARPLPGMRGVG